MARSKYSKRILNKKTITVFIIVIVLSILISTYFLKSKTVKNDQPSSAVTQNQSLPDNKMKAIQEKLDNGDKVEIEKFADFIAKQNIVMYGTYWCPNCQEQKALFGELFKKIEYVECDKDGPNPQVTRCDKNRIEGYPTWIYNNRQYSGYRPLSELARVFGFEDSSLSGQ